MVEAQGPRSLAGAFVPLLHDAGVLNETTPVSCPALGDRPPVNVSLSDLEKAFQSGGDGFDELARKLSGGYAYTLGYRDGPVLAGLRASDPDTLPILADLPAGEGNSPNHGRLGQNVLYIGGNVRWCTQRTVGQAGDDIYVNKHNLLRAGEGRSDTVLGPGDACPSGSE